MSGWTTLREIARLEIHQRAGEGCEIDPADWNGRLEACGADDLPELRRINLELQALPVPDACALREPDGWEAIRAQCPGPPAPPVPPPGEKELFDRIHGAWLGRCCGCVLGLPFEIEPYTRHPQNRQRHAIQEWLEKADAWPLDNYVPAASRAALRGLQLAHPASTRDSIRSAESDDNLLFPVLSIRMLEARGMQFDTWHVVSNWMRHLPYGHLPPAETQAFCNIVRSEPFSRFPASVTPPQADWTALATRFNPFREGLGARRRAALYGCLAPGDPVGAARMAWTDARASHVKNGVYAALFAAALAAAACRESRPAALVQAALSQIPAECRLACSIAEILELADKHGDWRDTWDACSQTWAQEDHDHAIPNTLLCVLALLYGGGDFERSLCIAAAAGLHPASNAAEVGTVLGMARGARALPPKWVRPLANTLQTGLPDQARTTISECASRTLALLRPGLY